MLSPELIAIFVFCMIGVASSSFVLGRREGMESVIDHLIDQGLLELDSEEE